MQLPHDFNLQLATPEVLKQNSPVIGQSFLLGYIFKKIQIYAHI
jgi:hypothetical protein